MDECNELRNLGPIEIQHYQQNRYPLLFLDYLELVVPGKLAKGHKNFSYNEWFFPAHFADEPNVPGFIQIETMAQIFIMTFLTLPGNAGKKTAFVTSEARFRKKIEPGMRLDLEAHLDSYTRGLARGGVVGTVQGEKACSLSMTACIPDILTGFSPRR